MKFFSKKYVFTLVNIRKVRCDFKVVKKYEKHRCEYTFQQHSKFINLLSNYNKLTLYILSQFIHYEKDNNKSSQDFVKLLCVNYQCIFN